MHGDEGGYDEGGNSRAKWRPKVNKIGGYRERKEVW